MFLFTVIFLIGKLFLNFKFLHFINKNFEWYELFWLGFVVVVAILQIWSFFMPVNIYSLFFITALGILSAMIFRKTLKFPKINLMTILYTGLILLAISYFASLPVGWEDTYLYHLNAVKWSNLYPVVPGLTNLHSRLGLNSSLFLFASMIDNWIMHDRSSHVALSLLASVLSIQILWIFLKSKNRVLKIFSLFVTPLLAIGIARSTLVASLSPDFALIMIVIAICFEVLNGKKESVFIASLLSLLLITIKFSGISFAGIILLFALFELRDFIFLMTAGLTLLGPFIARNIILSGWPFYPLPILGVNVPWAVPKVSVSGMYTVIKTWAISPGPDWNKSIGLSFWQWFPDWYSRNNWAVEMKMFFLGILLSLVSPLTGIITSDFFERYRNLLLLGLAAIISAFYMLFTAPDFRFGQIFFWVFFGVVGTCYVDTFLKKNPGLKILFASLGIYFIFLEMWPIRIDSEPYWKSVRWEPSFPVEETLIKPKDGSPTFKVYKPTDDDLCGNSMLPCTPYTSNKFKEISPGNISKGFAPAN